MDYDIIVIGGGHAGIEACLSCSKMGLSTLLVTQNIDTIGKLSCNPAIGGLAKGNIVREIDALGGVMGRLTDKSMIQFRILNKSKGPSVQSPRAQADKFLYQSLAKKELEDEKNLTLFQDSVEDFILKNNKIEGIKTERGNIIYSKRVVLTTGTFLNGRVFIGDYIRNFGRLGEISSTGIDQVLKESGHTIMRLKTGTPARCKKNSVDYSVLEKQYGDDEIIPFSFLQKKLNKKQLACYITYTNLKTHEIIKKNMHLSPLYSGEITGKGARYCPSIEDKIKKFASRDRHQIFIEPEGFSSQEVYLNGISTSLPEDCQRQFINSIKGLENAIITRPGYAVEYDCINPKDLYSSLESKFIKGLFIAGQTNGTSGYEEAAGQGLVAGINAASQLLKLPPLILKRSESYIGVLIDDLVTLGTDEPYRMFSSRAEHRIALRHNNADKRLFLKGYDYLLHTEKDRDSYLLKMKNIEQIKELLKNNKVKQEKLELFFKNKNIEFKNHTKNIQQKTLKDLLKMPEINMEDIVNIFSNLKNNFFKEELREAEIDIKYEGYIKRQEEYILSFNKLEKMKIPHNFNYDSIYGLSNESKEKLKDLKPFSIGQASRISGIRDSDIALLIVFISRKENKDYNLPKE